MVKDLKFQDFTAVTEDEDGDEHESTVRAAVVTKDTERTVVTRTGTHDAKDGDVLVETDRAGVYDVHSKDAWESTGYSGSSTATNAPPPPKSDASKK